MVRKVKFEDLAQELESIKEEFTKSFIYELGARTVEKAPVQSGQLRGSINISNNASDLDQSGVYDKSGSATKSKLKQQAQNLDPGKDAYVTAGTNYAGQVEYGVGGRAPASYIRGTVNEAQTIADKTARKIK